MSCSKPVRVFLSYKWEDEEHNLWVERLAHDLRIRGIDAWLDKWEVRLGESFTDYMTSAITRADVFLFVMTPSSVEAAEAHETARGAVHFEMQIATARKISGEDFRFIGLLREGNAVVTHLKGTRYLDFRNDREYMQMLIFLVKDLKGVAEKPILPAMLDVSLVAEPLVERLWETLPHSTSTLIEPASPDLQLALVRGLVERIRQSLPERTYSFLVFDTDMDRCEGEEIRDICGNIIEPCVQKRSVPKEDAIDKQAVTAQAILRPQEGANSESLRIAAVFRSARLYSRSLHLTLQLVRQWILELGVKEWAVGPKATLPRPTLSAIVMLNQISYIDVRLYSAEYSPWVNIFNVMHPRMTP